LGSKPVGLSASRGAAVLGKKERYAKWRASHLEQDRARSRAYYYEHKEGRRAYWEHYYAANKKRLIARARTRREANSEKIAQYNREYYQRDAEGQRKRTAAWRKVHPEALRAFNSLYYVQRRHSDPCFKIVTNLRNRINGLLQKAGTRKAGRTVALIGCTAFKLKAHIEAQFLSGMTWANHGRHGWHIDHIRPCASFDLTDPEQQRACFHYMNLQPLWAADNIRKGARLGFTA
jgi:hypothetical protein